MDIQDTGALVVGGASGLGEATVRRLYEQGAVVTIADVNAEKGQALADELGVRFVPCDVREEDQVQAAVDAAAEAAGGLRISVCCAGTGWAQKVTGSKGPHPLMPFEVIIGINLIGTFNVLRVLNRELRADFDVDAFEHVAFFDREREWIEMRLRAQRRMAVHIEALDLDVEFAPREELRTEISAKFTPERLRGDLAAAGLELLEVLTDEEERFALSLSAPR